MVLQELGDKLTGALRRLQTTTVVNDDVLNDLLQDVCRALVESDVNIKVVATLRKGIKEKVNLADAPAGLNRRKMVQRAVMEELVRLVDSGTKPYQMKKGKSNVIMFVGLQGSGKTTTIAKYANYYQRKGWKTCMVCADTFRAGAFDQLKQNATKLRVPFYGSYTEADPVRIAEEGVQQFRSEGYEVIIVDTSGRHKQEEALFEEMKEIQAAVRPDNVVYVMDATQGQAVFDQAQGFHQAAAVGSVIVTKLDGHAKGGGALSAVAATGAPIIFLGSGEHFDDLDVFNPGSFISRLLGLGDMRGFLEEVSSLGAREGGKERQEAMAQRLVKGQFTLRDMYEQFENVMKLGPLSKVMGMLPGFPSFLMGGGEGGRGGQDEAATGRLKRFLTMMDSMTDAELDGKVDLNKSESRVNRIARGSGAHPMEVQFLLKTYAQFSQMFKKMGPMMLKGGEGGIQRQMARNPGGVMNQLSKAVDPRMLQQMGGAKGMMDMMKAMGGGMGGGLADMLQNLGGGGEGEGEEEGVDEEGEGWIQNRCRRRWRKWKI
ncbi:signal recognition particle 54 kda protein [Nannochloropsis gaditana]|uniref:Signal recognition particle 54 kDa protein n=1 Tax=Nannochloropsis gaditana TaxID=72520 RepID=W7TM57_9STRA|nr:signal recognition particle 54 kda protein [Nannochloropsis gaditana]